VLTPDDGQSFIEFGVVSALRLLVPAEPGVGPVLDVADYAGCDHQQQRHGCEQNGVDAEVLDVGFLAEPGH